MTVVVMTARRGVAGAVALGAALLVLLVSAGVCAAPALGAESAPRADGAAVAPARPGEDIAGAGGGDSVSYLALGTSGALAVGSAALFASVRRRAVVAARHGR
ncbi:hypothetical protein ACPXCE_25345 [Streptomyces sp. DT24]|uniref:hypothetical protein n=1 Tax=unclassified Streptomyces TaxID=2593676 RepID=UPI0023B91394|nr:hypothetical protein [Streptomyces sp. AM 4-1-1]WEH32692.1 hypothetical protein PZB75_04440 [Streptomyces sp. AM 4-1-1]